MNINKVNKEFVENNVVFCARPHQEDDVLVSRIDDIDIFFRCIIEKGPEGWRGFAVNGDALDALNLDVSMLHNTAMSNAKKSLKCMSMSEMVGVPGVAPQMYVIRNDDGILGAGAAFMCVEILENLAHKLGVEKLYVIPSSIHEVICLPVNEDFEEGAINNIITMINSEMVEPSERLSDHVFIFNTEDRTIS